MFETLELPKNPLTQSDLSSTLTSLNEKSAAQICIRQICVFILDPVKNYSRAGATFDWGNTLTAASKEDWWSLTACLLRMSMQEFIYKGTNQFSNALSEKLHECQNMKPKGTLPILQGASLRSVSGQQYSSNTSNGKLVLTMPSCGLLHIFVSSGHWCLSVNTNATEQKNIRATASFNLAVSKRGNLFPSYCFIWHKHTHAHTHAGASFV